MKIEKGIPLPVAGPGRPALDLEIPFDDMEPGDSVLVRNGSVVSSSLSTLVKVRANRHGKAAGRKYTTQKQAEGVRLWRLS